MKNTNTRKTKLSTRILVLVLAALMVITGAVTAIYYFIDALTDDKPEVTDPSSNTTQSETADEKNQDLDHVHEDDEAYY